MAILVTRPLPDAETTAASLRKQGYEVMSAPMLRLEALPFHEDDTKYGAVIVTSANALRAMEAPLPAALLKLPLFAVGEQTAAAAREAGFKEAQSAKGDASALLKLISKQVKAKVLKTKHSLLYLAGEDRARDLATELDGLGVSVVLHTVYKMVPAKTLPRDVCDAFAAGGIEAVLHYSRRSARAFLEAARDGGVEITALALPQCCISATVAAVVREAGAAQVAVADSPDEKALFEALTRTLKA